MNLSNILSIFAPKGLLPIKPLPKLSTLLFLPRLAAWGFLTSLIILIARVQRNH